MEIDPSISRKSHLVTAAVLLVAAGFVALVWAYPVVLLYLFLGLVLVMAYAAIYLFVSTRLAEDAAIESEAHRAQAPTAAGSSREGAPPATAPQTEPGDGPPPGAASAETPPGDAGDKPRDAEEAAMKAPPREEAESNEVPTPPRSKAASRRRSRPKSAGDSRSKQSSRTRRTKTQRRRTTERARPPEEGGPGEDGVASEERAAEAQEEDDGKRSS